MPASQRMMSSSLPTGSRPNACRARLSGGTPATKPSVNRLARPSRRTSIRPSGRDPGGAARTTSAASRSPRPLRWPAKTAAPSASRYASRLSVAESFESVGRTDQQRQSVAAAPAGEDDLGAEPCQPRPLKLIQRAHLRGGEELERRVGSPGLEVEMCRGHRPRSAPGRIRRQLGRAPQKRGRRRDTTPGPGPVG